MFTIIIITLFAVATAGPSIDFRMLVPSAGAPPSSCTAPGRFCSSCTTVSVCLQNIDDTFEKINAQTCKSPQKCIKGYCSSAYDPFCDNVAALPFQCRSVGIFPDPFYCDKFILCVQDGSRLRSFPNECPSGFGYNLLNGLCDVILKDGCNAPEEYPVPLCEFAGDSGGIPSKPAMYYICEEYPGKDGVIYPVLNTCPGELVYRDYGCRSSVVQD